jgi:hypothetical protein
VTTRAAPALKFDKTFPRAYFIEEVAVPAARDVVQLVPREPVFFFPAEIEPEIERVPAVALRVTTAAKTWVGVFAKAFESAHVSNGLWACPDPQSLFVVAGGYAYIVNAADPRQWQKLDANPITDVRPVRERELLVFADYLTLTAWGRSGTVWSTERLTWDGLRITEVTADKLRGFGWDLQADREVEFVVDLATGSHRGGARPAKTT